MRRYALPVMLGIICSVMLAGCQSFGKKLEFNKGELYYTDSVTEVEANKLGNYLVQEQFFDGKEKTVQLKKEGNTYQVRFVIQKAMQDNQEVIDGFEAFSAEASSKIFNNAPVEVHICDDRLNTVKVVKANG